MSSPLKAQGARAVGAERQILRTRTVLVGALAALLGACNGNIPTGGGPDISGGGCPTWLAFLDRVTGGDAELQAFHKRMTGYSLTGCTSAHA